MELIVILTIVVIIFGVGKLPEIGSGLGEGIKNFKKSYREAKALDVTDPSQVDKIQADKIQADKIKS